MVCCLHKCMYIGLCSVTFNFC
uniref:Uncharacterized protein n=1 Tax=Arundo donax TaxID=35708 RepID=A0A0A9FH51_ARUDO